MRVGKQVRLAVLAATISSSSIAAPPVDRRFIPTEEARQLVYEAIKAEDADAVVDYTPSGDEADFYVFSTEWSGPLGDPGLGYFKVNRWTGDVWNVIGVVCRRVSSPTINRMQSEIRKRAGWKEPGYSGALRAKRPSVCESG